MTGRSLRFLHSSEPVTLHDRRWQELLKLMRDQRPYLNTQLIQADIAEALGISNRTLNRLLSQYTDCNFNSFINGYRLEEAQRLLSDSRLRRLSVATIAHRSGFNSRGVFYRAFKESTDVTPAQYRADS